MKKVITAAAFAVLLASPAAAQQHVWSHADGSMQPIVSGMEQPVESSEGTEAYAAYRGSGYGNVVVDGEVVGSDPDANIRFQLQRDLPANSNN